MMKQNNNSTGTREQLVCGAELIYRAYVRDEIVINFKRDLRSTKSLVKVDSAS
jgi:hypothetical protein